MSSTVSRRDFLSLSTGAAVLLATTPALALAGSEPYSPARFKALKASGQPFLLDYAAKWCGTCRTQARVIERLVAANPEYKKIAFIRVDWDKHRNDPIRTDLKVPRRSTLILMKGERELGRIVAQTRESQIKGLLDLA